MLTLGFSSSSTGRWFRLPIVGEDEEDCPLLKIRPVPALKRKELAFGIFGSSAKTKKSRRKEDGVQVTVTEETVDLAKSYEFAMAFAMFALVDVRNFMIRIPDAATAEVFADAGIEGSAPGAAVSLEGHLTDAVKERFLTDVTVPLPEEFASIASFIQDKTDASVMGVEAEEVAAGKT